jgi:hypothetical protein
MLHQPGQCHILARIHRCSKTIHYYPQSETSHPSSRVSQYVPPSTQSVRLPSAMSSTLSITSRYPPARRSDTINVYKSEARGEIKLPDPYQWLEENTEETRNWTIAQDAITKEYLKQYPDRQWLEDDIRSNTDYAKVFDCTIGSATTFSLRGIISFPLSFCE